MRHISPARLEPLEPLLEGLRALDGLVERTRGVFYLRGRAFLHFHEDGERDVYADVRLGPDWERRRVTTRAAQATLVRDVRNWVRAAR
jgi:hypothetical protein